MIELKWALGADGWLDTPASKDRREALSDLFREYALEPDQLEEDWSEERELFGEVVALQNGTPVATAMLIVDPERADAPARIFGQAALPEVESEFLVEAMEQVLVEQSLIDPVFGYVEGTGGRMIPIPSMKDLEFWSQLAEIVN